MINDNVHTYVIGYPRIGEKRELKKALEQFWKQKTEFDAVYDVAKYLRKQHWLTQKDAGISFISCNDFSLYDNMLDTAVMLNAIPDRFKNIIDENIRYFSMAKGTKDLPALDMTKWFNTNYHYIVPEIFHGMEFSLNSKKIINEFREAKELGIKPKINIIGPITFLSLSKLIDGEKENLDLLPDILPIYIELINQISALDDEIYIQFEEPVASKDLNDKTLDLLKSTYSILANAKKNTKIIVITYFDHASEMVTALKNVPLFGIGLDFIYGPENIQVISNLNGKKLIAGVVDGRNIWRNDYLYTLETLKKIEKVIQKKDIILSTSCSLLHIPYSTKHENVLDPEITSWLSFAKEKLQELADIASLFSSETSNGNRKPDFEKIIEQNRKLILSRRNSNKVYNKVVREKCSEIVFKKRQGSFSERVDLQKKYFNFPILPTTTIGSFPQTEELRKLRYNYRSGFINKIEYDTEIKKYIDSCIKFQEEIGLDVLVHGEPERNDMVEYFGENLSGFAITKNGWVQSYGSRCVKPPLIYGEIVRYKPITIDIISYARSKTKKQIKGILTGPVTMLNWSFIRNDIERSEVCRQLAISIYDEISDLQNAGIKIIQIDEAAFKEGYPLRKNKIAEYEKWAVNSFQLAISCADLTTQIHMHMCYSDFSDIIDAIKKMDADVISVEATRSGIDLLKAFHKYDYKNEIGPGVIDVHSSRIPEIKEIVSKIELMLNIFSPSVLWINPDCGLKTRNWEEVKDGLRNMIAATDLIRNRLLCRKNIYKSK